jgi:hypothetical protein
MEPTKPPCKSCGGAIDANSRHRVYCSDLCRYNAKVKYILEWRKKNPQRGSHKTNPITVHDIRVCVRCRAVFMPHHRGQKHCSPGCAYKTRLLDMREARAHARKKLRPLLHKVCERCRMKFSTRSGVQVFCEDPLCVETRALETSRTYYQNHREKEVERKRVWWLLRGKKMRAKKKREALP